MTLTEIRQVLEERNIQLTKSLGQNFLFDQNQLRKIVESAELNKNDKVLEIGPGLGPLTELLLQEAAEVLAIETDARLVAALRERFGLANEQNSGGRFQLEHADALALLREQPRDWSGWKLVSNLPYSVASPILVELAQAPGSPERLVATLQMEVAQRLVAKPGTADYGLLTLLVQLEYEPGALFKIPASCFFPAPEVDSACVCLMKRKEPLLSADVRKTFRRVVKQAFSQRRKMMLKLLKEQWPVELLKEAFERTEISPEARAETVSLEQFVKVTGVLTGNGIKMTGPEEIFDVVNDQDEVIGQERRSEVHRLGLKHRAVHVLVFNKKGEVFLQKRSLFKDRQPGVWDSSSSGHVDRGEEYDACARRELREELGLAVSQTPQRIFKIAAGAETDQEHVWVYQTEAEGPFTMPPEEIETGKWVAPAAVDEWIRSAPWEFASAFRHIWQKFRIGQQ